MEIQGNEQATENTESSQVADSGEGQAAPIETPEVVTAKPGDTVSKKISERVSAKAAKVAKTPEVVVAPPAVPGMPEYVPNTKFKVLDKEMEFDPFIKDILKSKEVEGKVRELYEKAEGLPRVKAERNQFRQEAQEHKGYIEHASKLVAQGVQTGDFRAFFDLVKIPEDALLAYAIKRAEYRNLDPAQQRDIDGQYNVQQKAMTLEQQNQFLLKSLEQQSETARRNELQQELSRPEVQQVAQAYNARTGNPNAFWEQVRRVGAFHWHERQVDISAHEAVEEVLNLLGGATPMQNPVGSPSTAVQPTHAGQSHVPVHQTPPIIPNIRGNGSSPVKKVIRTMDDLKKRAREIQQG